MVSDRIRFGTAVISGLVVMILFALVTVNILDLVPLAGPFVGGIVAGAIAGKNVVNGASAGIISGFFGAIIISFDFMENVSMLKVAVPVSPAITGILFLISAIIYFPLLAALGGALGGIASGNKLP